ncbi:ornithine decarboxylase [Streptomyces sp. MC1]|uniref:aminotransferase class I/II-fold pyridoxal phosphate-dependent enzyme n=1 Tax=Streptomyces TaxID=1883 RepID=UPI0004C620FB|nr:MULTISPECIES: aminotransferase class I/II-fold pyridoxal phosphate-dependent enzyme [unclassified Streptomyces]KOX01958.1 ornithine decarboxylase [Streptomyces sp. NRRL WC-3723]MBG7703111.1 ornithine decarboxylase [Streptomyces sp. MC1]
MDHSRVPVLEALQEFRRRGDVAYGPPGHKQGRGTDPRVAEILGLDVFRADVLSLNGLDDRRQSQGVLEQAQELMADAVGAEHAFFSTCGSSLSVKTAMCSVAGPGEKLLLSRNAHKSVIAAVIINGVEPIWVHPKFDAERHMAHPPEADDVRNRLREHPDAKGMLLITPTDWGTCADVRAVADACHASDVPLIVDEAWGAHLPFHPDLPAWGMDADADLVVTSVHKMGGAIEQSSVFHLQHDRVSPTVLKQREDLLGTTSASSLVYATLDGWRRQMVEQGHGLLDAALHRAERIRARLRELTGLRVMGGEIIEEGLAAEFDPLKIVVDVRDLGISGMQAAEWLRANCHIDVGGSDTCRISASITHSDDEETEKLLVESVSSLVERADTIERQPAVHLPEPHALELEQAVLPRDAFFGPAEQVPAERAVGRVAAETISPYPPGVPVVAPGEVITAEVVDYLRSGVAHGFLVPDAADSSLETFRVVARP